MAIAIQTNNNNKGDDTGIATGCGFEGPWTKSELDGSEPDIREAENIGSMGYVQTRWVLRFFPYTF